MESFSVFLQLMENENQTIPDNDLDIYTKHPEKLDKDFEEHFDEKEKMHIPELLSHLIQNDKI